MTQKSNFVGRIDHVSQEAVDESESDNEEERNMQALRK